MTISVSQGNVIAYDIVSDIIFPYVIEAYICCRKVVGSFNASMVVIAGGRWSKTMGESKVSKMLRW